MPARQQMSAGSVACSSWLRAIQPGRCLTSRVRLPYPWTLCGAAVRPSTVHRREAGTGVSRGRSSRKEGPRPFPASCLGSSPWGLSAPVQVYKEVEYVRYQVRMNTRGYSALAALAVMVLGLAACQAVSDRVDGHKESSTATAATSATTALHLSPTPGRVTVAVDKTHYAPTDTISVMIVNGLPTTFPTTHLQPTPPIAPLKPDGNQPSH